MTIVNDLSARDVQLPQGQFYKGKSFRGFGPVGPSLVLLTPEEGPLAGTAYAARRERAYASGRLLRRHDRCPAVTLTELASVHDLNAGDLMATGTWLAARRVRPASRRCSSSDTS